MIKLNYDSETGQILGFYSNEIEYQSIPEPYVEIDEVAYYYCINNQGCRKVDIETKNIISFEPVIPEQTPLEYAWIDTTVLDMAETMVALNERITKLEGGK